MTKVHASPGDALPDLLRDDITIAVGGFGLSGNPFDLIEAVRDSGVTGLTIVSNNMGTDSQGLGLLLERRQVRRVIASYVGENRLFARQYLDGTLAVEFCPQGTLAERLRAGGAGIAGFYTRAGSGTPLGEGKPTMDFEGRTHLLERGLRADVGLVHARLADREGNLCYRLSARNFNPLVAMASDVTVAEADEVITTGWIAPDAVHTPGIHVHRVVLSSERQKPIEKRTTRATMTGVV